MPANKNHHFVPQFLMRNFSRDGRSITSYLLKHRRIIPSASIAGQCQEEYFYGRDLAVERAFSELEGTAKGILEDISPAKASALTEIQLFDLIFFIYLQQQRTATAAKRADLFMEAAAKSVLEHHQELKDIDLNAFTINHKFPQGVAILAAVESMPILTDLEICFLLSTGKMPFLLSDNPSAPYNQWGENHGLLAREYDAATGIASKGIQLFMPVSPEVCAFVYDPAVYKVDGAKSRIRTIGKADVQRINQLQAANADSCLYGQFDEGQESY